MFTDLVILSTLCALATGSCLDTNSGKVTCKAFVCLKLCGKGLKHVDLHCQGSCGVCDNKALAVQQTPPSVPSLTPVLTAVNATSFRIAWTLSAEKNIGMQYHTSSVADVQHKANCKNRRAPRRRSTNDPKECNFVGQEVQA